MGGHHLLVIALPNLAFLKIPSAMSRMVILAMLLRRTELRSRPKPLAAHVSSIDTQWRQRWHRMLSRAWRD